MGDVSTLKGQRQRAHSSALPTYLRGSGALLRASSCVTFTFVEDEVGERRSLKTSAQRRLPANKRNGLLDMADSNVHLRFVKLLPQLHHLGELVRRVRDIELARSSGTGFRAYRLAHVG